MTKNLLLTGAVALSTLVMMGQNFESPKSLAKMEMLPGTQKPTIESIVKNAKSQRKAPAAKANEKVTTLDWRMGGDPYTALYAGMEKGYTDYGFMYVDAETATRLAGCKISALKFTNGIYYVGVLNKITAYLTEDIAGDPIFKEQKKVASSSYNSSTYEITWNSNEFDLSEPYTIKAGQGFYVGFSYNEVSSSSNYNYVYAIDYQPTDKVYGFLAGRSETTATLAETDFYNYTPYYGCLPISITISGDNIPQQDVSVIDIATETYGKVNEDYPVQVLYRNSGAQPVSSIGVKYGIEGETETDKTVDFTDGTLAYGEYGVLTTTANSSKTGHITFNFEVNSVNGVADEYPADNSISVSNIVCSETYPRNVYCDEFTGTWCGWCPRGYEGMEYMRKTYPDRWIGVAVHYNDEMTVEDLSEVYDLLTQVDGFPECMIDRKSDYLVDASQEYMEYLYGVELEDDVPGKISVTASHDDENIYVTSTSEVSLDLNADEITIEYIVKEDNVGPYDQLNYYAPVYELGYELNGWENLDQYVEIMYNDVLRARKVFEAPFASGMQSKKAATHTATISIPDEVKIDDTNVVALLVYAPTGEVLNAAVTKEYAGVNDIIGNQKVGINVTNGSLSVDGNAEVYSISGQRVASLKNNAISLPAGLYIVRANGKATKVLVK